MLNITQIPAPRVELIDPRTGLMSREWFRFFNNIYTIVGANLGVIQIVNGGTGLSTTPTDGQLLIGDTTTGEYVLNTLAAALGVSVTNGAGTITLSNTGVLSNVDGVGISVSSATGDVTITNTGVLSNLAGTGISISSATGNSTIANTGVLSVSGSAPVVSSGGATPVIAMPAATTSINGYLTSIDWNTFNNKLSAQVYPSAGIPSSTGTSWGSSYGTTGTGSVVLNNSPSLIGLVNLPLSQFGADITNIGLNVDNSFNTIQIGSSNINSYSTIDIGQNSDGVTFPTITNINGDVYFTNSNSITPFEGGIFTNTLTATSSFTAIGNLQLTGNSSSKQNIATAQTTGTLNVGGATGTGALTFGRSTETQTVNIATGIVASTKIKTINIGTSSAVGSTTNISIGSSLGTSSILINGLLNQQTKTVATLPTGYAGSRSFVTDALSPSFGVAVTGGGAVSVPVYYDGTSWKVG